MAEGPKVATLGPFSLASAVRTFGLAGRGGALPAAAAVVVVVMGGMFEKFVAVAVATGAEPDAPPPLRSRGLWSAPQSFASDLGPARPRPQGDPRSLRVGSLTPWPWPQHRARPMSGPASGAALSSWK